MLYYALTAGALFLGGTGASLMGLNGIAVALFPIPVMLYAARRLNVLAMGLTLCAALAAIAGGEMPRTALFYALIAASGFPMGIGIARRWTYGWTVLAAAGSIYLVVACAILTVWPVWLSSVQQFFNFFIQEIKTKAADPTDSLVVTQVQMLSQFRDNWAAISLGLLLWPLSVQVCLVQSLVTGWLRRRYGIRGPRGTFRTMRPTEWLIWVTIVVAILFMVDRQWPDMGLRVPVWNTAMGLAAIYWLNGASILLYAFAVLRFSPFVSAAIVLLLIWVGLYPVLCLVGLFDTWIAFRKVINRIAEVRRQLEQSGDES